VASAREEVERLERQNAKLARSLAVLTANESFDINVFEREARPVQQQLTAARTALNDEKFARSREDAWDRPSTNISETRNLADAWPNLGEEERKILIDYWGLRRADHRRAGARQASCEHQVRRGGAPDGPQRPQVLRARPSGVHRRGQLLQDRSVGFH
jgi:hypothetical protein